MIDVLAQSSTTSSQSGGLAALLVPLLLMGGLFYFLLIRPQKTRQRQQASVLNALEVGDEVMTAGGIFGTLKEIDDDTDTVTVEIAPGTDVRMLRRGIAQRLTEDENQEDDERGEEADDRS